MMDMKKLMKVTSKKKISYEQEKLERIISLFFGILFAVLIWLSKADLNLKIIFEIACGANIIWSLISYLKIRKNKE